MKQVDIMKNKVKNSGELTGIEKRTILTLIDRWYHPAEWVLMSEGYFVCSHCHNLWQQLYIFFLFRTACNCKCLCHFPIYLALLQTNPAEIMRQYS